MDGIEKLTLFKQYMDVEDNEETRPPSGPEDASAPCSFFRPEEPSPPASAPRHPAPSLPVYMAALPNGQRFPMLKTLLTSACERNCSYCAFRAGRDFRRETFKPDELARSFDQLFQKGIARGLFLSSGVAGGGSRTQDRLIDTVEILRGKMGYRGYLHLKIMPGAEKDQVLRAMQLADRVSVNLEGPNDQRLAVLAPQKTFMEELLAPLRWVEEIRRSQPGIAGWNHRWPSSTTQFVVGAAGEPDLELLRATAYLHQKLHLARVYFSRFSPVRDTPLEDHPAANPWRTHRLYQASFLLRDYGFGFEELPFAPDGNLPLDQDPKLAWARTNLSETPVEINKVSKEELLRIPGIGPRSAQAILAARGRGHLRSLDDLKSLGIRTNQALPFILLDGRRPPLQLALL